MFYKCETSDNGYNIYATPPPNQPKCSAITLDATQCAPLCVSSSEPTPSPSPTPSPTFFPPLQQPTCLAGLDRDYQFPHLIVPVDSTRPNDALGTSNSGVVVATEDSLFLFDVPAGYKGKTCALVFLLPEKNKLQTSSYDSSGSGDLGFAQLAKNVAQGTTWNSKGSVQQDFGVKHAPPGSATVVATFECPAGEAMSYQVSSSEGTSLKYFQDYNPPA